MISLPTRALLSAAAALLATVGIVTFAPTAVALVMAAVVASGFVAFVAQSRLLQDEKRLVYRPVPVRRHDVQRRVTFRDE